MFRKWSSFSCRNHDYSYVRRPLCTRAVLLICLPLTNTGLQQPVRLPSAPPGNQIQPPRPLGFITESLFAKLNPVTSSHRSGKASHHSWVCSIPGCLYRAAEIISPAQPAFWRDQSVMFVWMGGNLEFHRDQRRWTSRPLHEPAPWRRKNTRTSLKTVIGNS